jgi:hypothetical protein
MFDAQLYVFYHARRENIEFKCCIQLSTTVFFSCILPNSAGDIHPIIVCFIIQREGLVCKIFSYLVIC